MRSFGRKAPSGRRNRLKTPIGGPLTGRPSERVAASSDWHSRDSSPSAARSVRRAARTLPWAARGSRRGHAALRGRHRACVRRVGCGRRPEPSPGSSCSAAIVATSRWKRVSPASSGWNDGGDDVPLADGHDPAVVQPREDVDAGAGPLDDRGADEHGVDRPSAEDVDVEVGLERLELSPERIALDGHVEQRQDRLLAAGDLAREDDHPGARPEDGRARLGEVEDRLAQAPALDEPAHRRALAAGQDQAAEALEVGRLAHANTLDADGGERVEMLAERPLEGQDPDLHRGTVAARRYRPTSRGPRAAPAPGSPRGRCPASGLPGPSRPRRSSWRRRRTWSPARWRWPCGPGPRS